MVVMGREGGGGTYGHMHTNTNTAACIRTRIRIRALPHLKLPFKRLLSCSLTHPPHHFIIPLPLPPRALARYEEAMSTKRKLQEEADVMERRLIAADKLIGGLSGEKVRWAAQFEDLTAMRTKLVGDCLLGTFIQYSTNEGSSLHTIQLTCSCAYLLGSYTTPLLNACMYCLMYGEGLLGFASDPNTTFETRSAS
jgi:hypothetical protein